MCPDGMQRQFNEHRKSEQQKTHFQLHLSQKTIEQAHPNEDARQAENQAAEQDAQKADAVTHILRVEASPSRTNKRQNQ